MNEGQRIGKDFEKKLEAVLGGRRTPASGATWGSKGDVAKRFARPAWWSGVRVEAKATAKQSFSLRRQTLDKIELEALSRGELPVLALEIDGKTYGVVELTLLLDMIAMMERVSDLYDKLPYDKLPDLGD